jgi:adenine-specific DNA-methyltransferase
MANNLELTWYGKDEPIKNETRLLIENVALSNTALAPDTENMLIRGDNLLTLKALVKRFKRWLFHQGKTHQRFFTYIGTEI